MDFSKTPDFGQWALNGFPGGMSYSTDRWLFETPNIGQLVSRTPTSIRLGRFFGVSDRYFLDMQNDIEVRELIEKLDGDITTIKPYAAAAM